MTDEANEEIRRETRAILFELVAFTVLALAIAAVLALTA